MTTRQWCHEGAPKTTPDGTYLLVWYGRDQSPGEWIFGLDAVCGRQAAEVAVTRAPDDPNNFADLSVYGRETLSVQIILQSDPRYPQCAALHMQSQLLGRVVVDGDLMKLLDTPLPERGRKG